MPYSKVKVVTVFFKYFIFSFNTYSGIMKMYINAARKNGGVEVSSRMLRTGEDGLGGQDNSPPVVINADVNCDTITLVVDGATYKLDYGFGRLGVKDLGELLSMNFILMTLNVLQRFLAILRVLEWFQETRKRKQDWAVSGTLLSLETDHLYN